MPEGLGRKPRAGAKGGRDQVVASVLDAAEDLFASHSFREVTVRQIAAGAGVSHALVHRYLGGKRDILRAVIAREEVAIAGIASDADRIQDAARLMLQDLVHLRRYMLIVIRAAMDGVVTDAASGGFPATRLLGDVASRQAERAGKKAASNAVDPRFAAAAGVALAAGLIALEQPLLAAVGLEDLDRASIDEQLARVIERLFDATVPG